MPGKPTEVPVMCALAPPGPTTTIGLMVTVKSRSTYTLSVPVARSLNVDVAGTVGVPISVEPVRLIPVGSVPETSVHVNGDPVPVATRNWLYSCVTVPLGNEAIVQIVGGNAPPETNVPWIS